MSNSNAPNGFVPVNTNIGSAPNYALAPRLVKSDNAHTIGKGDVVISLSTGYIDIAAATDAPVHGVFRGCEYFDTVQGQWQFQNQYAPGSTPATDVQAFVINDPNAVFQVQSSGTAITLADDMINATFTGNGAPNSITGISTAALDQTSLSTTNTLPFRVIRPSPLIGNDNTSSYNRVWVKGNNFDLNQLTGI